MIAAAPRFLACDRQTDGNEAQQELEQAQASLLSPSPMDWLKKDHLVYFLLDVLPKLELQEIEAVIQEEHGRTALG